MKVNLSAGLTAAAMVFGLVGVPASAAVSAKGAADRPARCADIVQVWAGGRMSATMGAAAKRMPGKPEFRTVLVGSRQQEQPTRKEFRRIERRGLSAPYFRGYRARADKVARELRSQARQCPDSMLVVGGHSVGAVAARLALGSLSPRADARVIRRVGAVLLYGDPLTRRSDGRQLDERKLRGVLVGQGPQLRIPRWARRGNLVGSYCLREDPLCRWDRSAGSHVSYVTNGARDWFITPVIDGLPTQRVVKTGFAVGQRVSVDVRDEWSSPVVVSAERLPRGVSLRHGVIVGRLPLGRHVARLQVRGKRRAPAVSRSVKVVIAVRELAASPGTSLISRGIDGKPANGRSDTPQVSRDGQSVVFGSSATNLVTQDVSAAVGQYRRIVAYAWNAQTDEVELIGVDPEGAPMTATPVDVSADGRYVLLRGSSVYLRDRQTRVTTRLPIPPEWGGDLWMSDDASIVDYEVGDGRGWRGGQVVRWSRSDGSMRPLTMKLDDELLPADVLAMSPDGSLAAINSRTHGGFLMNVETGVVGPSMRLGDTDEYPWDEMRDGDLSDAGRLLSVRGSHVDQVILGIVVDLSTSTVLADGGAAVSADGAWYCRRQAWRLLQVRSADSTAQHDAFVRLPRGPGDEPASLDGVSLSGDGHVLAYSSGAVDLVAEFRPSVAQVYVWRVPN